MSIETRLDKRIQSKIEDGDLEVSLSPLLKNNLRFEPRPYQVEAFTAFNYYMNNPKLRTKPTQVLFQMATGAGKTLVMAGAILELYAQGYRNFVFFVNTDTIIRKTKENFLNPSSHKYLFANPININGETVNIIEVENFESTNTNSINILFTTIQGLHTKLNNPRENSISFDDFYNKEVVLISDEAHHINTLTKKKHTDEEKRELTSWEFTVNRILQSNANNVLLEFTATMELNHPKIAEKYNNKLLYDYSLTKFREDGYSKEVQTNQIDYEPIERAIIATIISQYKKKVFAHHNIIAKPIVMLKSKTTAESAEMEQAFVREIKSLTVEKLDKLLGLNNVLLNEALVFFEKHEISFQNLIDELKEDFSEDKIISVNSKNDSEEKQIVINNLEAPNNEYRAVFAVDKLNEGWDVLNLYDIVRLYDTRDAKGNQVGKTTIQEAQLIGRGARYYPFQIDETQEKDKRKYDGLDDEMKVCETLHYHCSHNPRYISELTMALRQIGLFPDEKVEVSLELKQAFKETKLYRNGFIFLNKKVKNDPKTLLEYQEPTITKKHSFTLRTNRSQLTTLFDDSYKSNIGVAPNYSNLHQFSTWDKTILLKALDKFPFYYFDNLQRYFPSVKSRIQFVTDENYFGGISVEVIGMQKDTKDLSRRQMLEIAMDVATKIASEITNTFGEYRGTKRFYREPLRKYFKNKKLQFTLNQSGTDETGRPTMRPTIPAHFAIDLEKADWYAYNENYGTSEEKYLVRFMQQAIETLQEKYKDIYLLRNERFFKLYRFSDGRATEPDFVLFMTDKQSDEETIYQLFIEPKGEHLLYADSWKEEFLAEIETEAVLELYQNQRYRLIGLPFYNKSQKEEQFSKQLVEVF